MTFEDGGSVTTQTGHYGDEITYPQPSGKVGYEFKEWSSSEDKITGSFTITAIYTPNVYTVTLVSEYFIEGFENVDGVYKKVIEFTYDGEYPLPKSRTDSYILNGFMRDGDDTVYAEYLPNVLEDTEFKAIWREIGYEIKFVEEDGTVVATRNKHNGESFTAAELPKVPEKPGYNSEWNIDISEYTVGGEAEIMVKRSPITYYIYEYSPYKVNGFDKVISDDVQYWRRVGEYVFGSGEKKLLLGDSAEVLGYDFDGYYTERNGGGTKIESITDVVIADTFNYNVGEEEPHNILYVNWKDNSVTVHLYSDIDFDGREGWDGDGYFKTYSRMEVEYTINETLSPKTVTGIQQLGWWYEDSSTGNCRSVTDIEEFMDEGRSGEPAKLFAMWIENIRVCLTELSSANKTYDIKGIATGGSVYGQKVRKSSRRAVLKRRPRAYIIFTATATAATTRLNRAANSR